jgi:thiosulfate dehydrogenase [quinone] large subunit
MNEGVFGLSGVQQTSLIILRTLIGWHFLYEGYVKVLGRAWARTGTPIEPFTAAGYLQNATGPFSDAFRALAHSSWLPLLDIVIPAALVAAGVLLMLGLFTQAGCVVAMALLASFYLSGMPLRGVPEPHAEGTYLIVNKNLVEAAAVFVLFVFRTGRIAGLDRLRRPSRALLRASKAAA